MRLAKILHKISIPQVKFSKLEKLLFKNTTEPNLLWNNLIRFSKLLSLLKNIILGYAGLVLLLTFILGLVYQKSLWQIAFWPNFPTYFLLVIYFRYRKKSLSLYKKFAQEIEKRRVQNISLQLPQSKIILLRRLSILTTFYSFRILFIFYTFWIIWTYFYFYPQPQKIKSLISQAKKIEAKIHKHQEKTNQRLEEEKGICNKIQTLYLHKEREEKKWQALQRKVWQRYSNVKQVQHKIVELNKHLTKAKKQNSYLYLHKNIIEELANWVALKAELKGEKAVFDENKSDLKVILLDLINKYHRVKQKAQEAIYLEQAMLKDLKKRIETLQNMALKLERYQGEQETLRKQN